MSFINFFYKITALSTSNKEKTEAQSANEDEEKQKIPSNESDKTVDIKTK